ncbi:MAG TPA: NAD(P)-binding domain-containing protein, partial [Terracidiphilus sp.]
MTILPIAPRIVVLGSGAWGTALALTPARNGRSVTIWAHSPEAAKEIVDLRRKFENIQFLPGFELPPEVVVTGENAAVASADIIVSVVPSEFLRSTLARL